MEKLPTDPATLEAVLEQLKAEQARRLQAKIDSGEVVLVQTVVVVHPDEDEEAARARAVARHPAPDDGREVHREFFYITTGVPRPDPDFGAPSPQVTASSSEEPSQLSEGPAASRPSCSEPTYVRVTIRNGDDNGDPGAIAEAYFTIDDGAVVLRDADDKHITSRALPKAKTRSPLPAHCCARLRSRKTFTGRLAIRSWAWRSLVL